MTGRLQDRRIIVTGGGNGIGAATIRAYAEEGARVVALDVDDTAGSEVVEKVCADGGVATYRHCDVSRKADVDDVFGDAVAWLGGLDVLAHIAGIELGAAAEEIPEQDWDQIFDVNVKGTLLTNQAAFAHMKESGGRIINFGSGAGIRGEPGAAHYSASKGAVMAWSRTAAIEWGPRGVSVNCVAPAAWTRMYDGFRSRMSPDELALHDKMMKRVIPLGGRLGDPERDIAPVMVFLASSDACFINGQVVAVDGGAVMLGS
jgi:NAD(P)-dependent dehydrogenase (short-subunit alcohol dehydrogenase family)